MPPNDSPGSVAERWSYVGRDARQGVPFLRFDMERGLP